MEKGFHLGILPVCQIRNCFWILFNPSLISILFTIFPSRIFFIIILFALFFSEIVNPCLHIAHPANHLVLETDPKCLSRALPKVFWTGVAISVLVETKCQWLLLSVLRLWTGKKRNSFIIIFFLNQKFREIAQLWCAVKTHDQLCTKFLWN